MIVTSSGIVLSTLRYSDSSLIVKIYTRNGGLKSFMFRVGKGKSAIKKMGFLQPLSLVTVCFRDGDSKSMYTARTIEREEVLKSFPFEPVKTCVALFIAEVIGRAIGEEEDNEELFKFLKSSILLLDDSKKPANFHLKFMVEFTRFLGFYPQRIDTTAQYFDMAEGEFVSAEPLHPYFMNLEETITFSTILNVGMSGFDRVQVTNLARRALLQKLIDYYRLHLEGMREIKSHKVLEEVLA